MEKSSHRGNVLSFRSQSFAADYGTASSPILR